MVVSLAVLADDNPHWHPHTFAYDLWDCGVSMRFPTVKLWDLDATTLAATVNPMATVSLIHRDAQHTRTSPAERMQRKLAHFRACLRQGYTGDDLRHLYRILDQLMRLPSSMDAPVRATMRQIEQEEVGMSMFITSIERLARDEGKAEGKVEGKVEGKAEGKAEGLAEGQQQLRQLVLRQLTRKVGAVDAPVREHIEALPHDALLHLSEALLDFTTSDDLVAWLKQDVALW